MARPRTIALEDRKADIIQSALTILTAKGYANVRLDDVADKARIAKGTLYLYFRNKESLFAEVVTSVVARLDAQLWGNGVQTSALEELRAIAAAEATFISEHRDFLAQFSFQKVSALGLAATRTLKAWFSEHVERLSRVLDRAVTEGSVRSHDTRQGALFFIGLCRMFALHLVPPGDAPSAQQLDDIMNFFMNGVGSHT